MGYGDEAVAGIGGIWIAGEGTEGPDGADGFK